MCPAEDEGDVPLESAAAPLVLVVEDEPLIRLDTLPKQSRS
jgi:hypothetical protein